MAALGRGGGGAAERGGGRGKGGGATAAEVGGGRGRGPHLSQGMTNMLHRQEELLKLTLSCGGYWSEICEFCVACNQHRFIQDIRKRLQTALDEKQMDPAILLTFIKDLIDRTDTAHRLRGPLHIELFYSAGADPRSRPRPCPMEDLVKALQDLQKIAERLYGLGVTSTHTTPIKVEIVSDNGTLHAKLHSYL